MEWTDQGIILGLRRQGEGNVVLDLMTRTHGRHVGLVRGGRSPRLAATLQPGNSVLAIWRARLDEHLGHFQVEASAERAGRLMESASGLYALQTVLALARLLPERDPHPEIHAALEAFLDVLAGRSREPDDPPAAPLASGGNAFLDLSSTALLVARLEIGMLDALGFGLDLSACAVTGARDDLAFVSPKSGRAVGAVPGAPYADRLLRLPPALLGQTTDEPSTAEARDALALTGHFLDRHVYLARGLAPPEARAQLIALLGR